MRIGKKAGRRGAVATAALLLIGVAAGRPAEADTAAPPPSVIAQWAQRVSETVDPTGELINPEEAVWHAYVSLAMYNAVVGIEGRYVPYRWRGARAARGASAEAAAATAAYQVLRTGFPQAGATLEQAWQASLAKVPDGPGEKAGVAFGQRSARHLMALRANDGRGASVPFTPAPAPGVWRPTPPAHQGFTSAWIGRLRPFLLDEPGQFRPGPPPRLTSARYARDLAEVKAYGAKTGSRRSAWQTETARFVARVEVQYPLGDHAARHGFDIVETARLYAAVNTVIMDATITAWDAKLHYGTWRPVTAIREADTDGNPATRADPTWEPLLITPAHPDYLSGHATWGAAWMRTLERLLGTSRVDLDMRAADTGAIRHYEYAEDYVRDVVDARVWAGIHTRTADTVGAVTGKQVASWAMERYFRHT
ncbi:vanadium-dependent haloperoxidase [Streptomyces sp. NPDC090994]|uniref:vanadium-dependent haloperoxidase n=1 Tax=Streptomyces sp. NPDC090994 TaxID=3365969 RepID=UPI003825FF8D